ncbi:putative protein arginine N-methyltransferase 3 [Citrus sinensis]|uniref:Uncharacterized protein n=1 Tax=Citrus sinensis TaxID=2711 RepID=A0ACB8KD87_CITSI|nr:putative protein arginine N-methyltransferase 3 [Citrus sinensis]
MGSNNKPETEETRKRIEENHEEEEEEEETEQDWGDWSEDDGGLESGFLCLFCDAEYSSCDTLFEHCRLSHCFDFHSVKTELRLDFYGSFKLINYIRSQLHTHENSIEFNIAPAGDVITKIGVNTRFSCSQLNVASQNLLLANGFGEDEVDEEDNDAELMRDVMNFENISVDDGSSKDKSATNNCTADEIGKVAAVSTLNGHPNMENSSEKMIVNGLDSREHIGAFDSKLEDKDSRVSLLKLSAKDIKKVNESYFGSYSSFGIHREMISDKVRTDSYRQAILENPSLMKGAVVMDIGCGTGILSLFAAQAGASRVIAVEASEKMAAVATHIAKDNDFWWDRPQSEGNINNAGKMEVVQGMVEELGESMQIQPHSVDVLVSEWMGYCLLYESMLSSVLFARDQWLKPGGAILPDTATMFVAGFGRGGTSLPFWENVYGFNMSCVGREVVRDAAGIPIVDVVDDHDLVTDSVVLQHDEVDFTTSVELEPKLGDSTSNSTELRSTSTWCYGIVLWFDAGFTSRFCKEKPVVLSTSPYTPKTHWSQTIITFREPIALALGNLGADGSAAVGTDACPARRIHLRVSIARGAVHRSIDISMETAGVGPDGQKRSWPAQIFNLS